MRSEIKKAFDQLICDLQNDKYDGSRLQEIFDLWYGIGYDDGYGADDVDVSGYSDLEHYVADEASYCGHMDS
jgi:hypothetical protein